MTIVRRVGHPHSFLLLGVFLKLSLELAELLGRVADPGVGVYSARVLRSGNGFHFEIALDGLDHPLGAVTIAECESFSRRFVETLDRVLEEGHPDWGAALPVGILPDNYTVEVNSAGAERQLRLPEELERFRGKPLKIQHREEERTRTRLGVFVKSVSRETTDSVEITEDVDQNYYIFEEYTPRRGGANRKRSGKQARTEFRLASADLLRVNLYLDF